MLIVSGLSKRYGNDLVLTIGSLELPPGIHWIKGHNGSGKTTFFKCVAGIAPCSGEISVDGMSLRHDPLHYRKHVTYSEAEPVYPSFLTAGDLIRFVAGTRRASATEVAFCSESLGVKAYIDKACGACSSGMLKKLSLALAFLGNPRLIILDEPLITLDEATRGRLYDMINKKKGDTIFLLSSHHSMDGRGLQISSSYYIRNKTLVHD